MNELQLVGYTADLRYLVFEDAQASRVFAAVDDDLLETLDEIIELTQPDRDRSGLAQQAAVSDAGAAGNVSRQQLDLSAFVAPAGDSSDDSDTDGEGVDTNAPPRRTRALAAVAVLGAAAAAAGNGQGGDADGERGSRLSPREIQTLLRSGMSIRAVARQAETDESWVRRWLPPIEAERTQVLNAVLTTRVHKPRLGPSRDALGGAVEANLSAKGIRPDDPSIEWSAARRERDDYWTVTLRYRSRGRRQRAIWRFHPESKSVEARNKVAVEVGWSGERGSPAPGDGGVTAGDGTPDTKAVKATGKKRAAKKTAAKKASRAAKSDERPARSEVERERRPPTRRRSTSG